MKNVSCEICGNKYADFYIQMYDFQFNRIDRIANFVRCNNCGLIYQNPQPTQEEVINYYQKDYTTYSNLTKVKGLNHWFIKFGMWKRERFIKKWKSRGELLDIGCGTGLFLHYMKSKGWIVKGVEINQYSAELAKIWYDLDIFCGDLYEAKFPSESFSAITMWDVLEHVLSPRNMLDEIHRILRPDGVLIIRIPNGNAWDAKLFGRYWAGYEPPRHLFVFNKYNISRLLCESGFKPIDFSSEFGSYMTFILNIRFWLTEFNIPIKLKEIIIKLLYNPFMRILAIPLFSLLSLGTHGPSMTITAIRTK